MKRTNIGLVLILIMLLAVNFVNAQNFEGFETGNFLSYNWQFSGAVNWNTTFDDPYEGILCAKSGITAIPVCRKGFCKDQADSTRKRGWPNSTG